MEVAGAVCARARRFGPTAGLRLGEGVRLLEGDTGAGGPETSAFAVSANFFTNMGETGPEEALLLSKSIGSGTLLDADSGSIEFPIARGLNVNRNMNRLPSSWSDFEMKLLRIELRVPGHIDTQILALFGMLDLNRVRRVGHDPFRLLAICQRNEATNSQRDARAE